MNEYFKFKSRKFFIATSLLSFATVALITKKCNFNEWAKFSQTITMTYAGSNLLTKASTKFKTK